MTHDELWERIQTGNIGETELREEVHKLLSDESRGANARANLPQRNTKFSDG
jgi:hypothetical protein